MYDIHCHIIPDVDDGSGSMSDSVQMSELAYNSGVRAIIATPHCNIPDLYENYRCSDFNVKLENLNERLRKEQIPVTVYAGQEISMLGEKNVASLLKKGDLITLNYSRYPLIEFDFYERENSAFRYIEELCGEGYVPVVAHAERYKFVHFNFESIEKMRSLGALVQINAGSLDGDFGVGAKLTAKKILHEGMADFVASDAHSPFSRTPVLSGAHEFICENISYEYADILFNINPLKVINNEEIR